MIGGISIIDLIKTSWVIDFIIFIAIYSLGMIIERLWSLYTIKGKNDKFMQTVINLLNEGNIEQAKYVCEQMKSPISKVLHSGISNFDAIPESVSMILENTIDTEKRKMERGVDAIGLMTYIAPLLGLLGSLVGIISVFSGTVNAIEGSTNILMRGVAESLVSVVLGISIAIICAIAYSGFKSRVNDISADLKQSARYYLSFIKGEINIA
ncbi:MotA/TolQ/ExbB proton channel family protein [candidate division WOR-3 bacterium]|nr:MotA/TolQ/ExbB proton channel family protein [candidate division WOR-3 bacterium]